MFEKCKDKVECKVNEALADFHVKEDASLGAVIGLFLIGIFGLYGLYVILSPIPEILESANDENVYREYLRTEIENNEAFDFGKEYMELKSSDLSYTDRKYRIDILFDTMAEHWEMEDKGDKLKGLLDQLQGNGDIDGVIDQLNELKFGA